MNDAHSHRIARALLAALGAIAFSLPVSFAPSAQEAAGICINLYILEGSGTTLSFDSRFPDASAPVGEPAEYVRAMVDGDLLSGLNRVWAQCGFGVQRDVVVVIRPELVDLNGATLDKLVLDTQTRGPGIAHSGLTLYFLGRAVGALEAALLVLRQRSSASCLHVFLVGRIHEEGIAGFAQLNGSLAVVRWLSIFAPPPVGVMAHEMGHNLGLRHAGEDGIPGTAQDPGNLMHTPLQGESLLPAQCAIAQQRLLQLGMRGR